MGIAFTVDGRSVEVPDDGASLLEALRDRLGVRSPKDGCSPQGQCGCCTVLVDGHPRVSCVTPARRVAGREVTTLDGLPDAQRWADAFTDHGASQCGFCTPGIIVRLAAQRGPLTREGVEAALVAHLCRCTGWRTIVDAALEIGAGESSQKGNGPPRRRDPSAAAQRATLEGGSPQRVGGEVARGEGGFADDTAPMDALVAIPGPDGWVVAPTLVEARARAGKVQGRRTTTALTWPLDVPPGEWDLTLRTTWVEPAYLEPDAAWCAPGGLPVGPLANGGAFGGKTGAFGGKTGTFGGKTGRTGVAGLAGNTDMTGVTTDDVAHTARRLADEHGRPVRVVRAREDVVRSGPKRPPIAAGIRADGSGIIRVARTPGIAERIRRAAPEFIVEEVDVPGPPTSAAIRGAGWAEVAVLRAAAARLAHVTTPEGAWATADLAADGTIAVTVAAGPPLDEIVLRSYCIGAAHQALGWVTSEAIAVDEDGVPEDLTIRSFGILRARDMPDVTVDIVADETMDPVNGSDAVFAAVAAAVWMHKGLPPAWPTDRK